MKDTRFAFFFKEKNEKATIYFCLDSISRRIFLFLIPPLSKWKTVNIFRYLQKLDNQDCLATDNCRKAYVNDTKKVRFRARVAEILSFTYIIRTNEWMHP